MQPGRACITCHRASKGESIVEVGGTVYPTIREPDGCFGVDGTQVPATVVITEADGRVTELPVGPTGNFSLRRATPVAFPIRAKVVANGRERVMLTPQNSGDCNGCHSESGRNGAPGRISLP
jgi:hypothetical protein